MARPSGPVVRLRTKLLTRILEIVGASDEFDIYRAPAGDKGLFSEDSIAWVIHRDLPAMLIGGIAALMLQTLHPLAMSGIAEHSRFREDPLGRLHRTARFIAGTTFGPRHFTETLIAEVRRVHRRVVGTAADGRPYAASNPDLLAWVHTTEVVTFLRSYEIYGPRRLNKEEKDRYLTEVAVLAYSLGATAVPENLAATDRYFHDIAGELVAIPEAFEAVAFLRTPVSDRLVERIAHRIVTTAAIDLLPEDARDMLRLGKRQVLVSYVVRVRAKVLGVLMRWAVGPSKIAGLATERIQAPDQG